MAILNEQTCEYCKKSYTVEYITTNGYSYSVETHCCSKSCATSLNRSISRDELEKKALDFVRAKNEYCTKTDICKGVGHSSKTFTKHGVSFSSINKQLGFIKPRSKFQSSVSDVLDSAFAVVENEKVFDGLVGNTGAPLRVDFYIPEINTVVEADGSQHSDPDHPWSKWNNGTVAEYDKIKETFFETRNIRLVRIPYSRNVKEADILSRLE